MTIVLVLLVILCLGGAIYWLFMSTYSQVFGRYLWHLKTDEKIVALTFDDGPNEPYTSDLVNYFNDKGVKATFFQVGKCVERYPETTRKMFKEGHVIGNHSLSHEFHKFFTEPDFNNQVIANQKILKKTIGKTPALFRSPWLWRQPKLLNTLKRHKLIPISGEFCHSLEVLQIDGELIAKAAMRKVKPGSIIIFHDGFDGRGGNRAETVKAAKIVVDNLLEEGYKLVTVDKLFGIDAYQD